MLVSIDEENTNSSNHLLLLLTTISSNQKIKISKFDIKKINIENNFLTKKKILRSH